MANKGFYSTFNISRNEVMGKLFHEIDNSQWDIPELRKQLAEILSENKVIRDYRLERDFPRFGHLALRLNARVLRDAQNTLRRILLAFDVTTNKD